MGTLARRVLGATGLGHRQFPNWPFAYGARMAAACLVCAGSLALGQEPMVSTGGGPLLFPSDEAILEAQETRKEIPCTVTPVKPNLGFDMKFHAGYDVSVPLKELAGLENQLKMIFRVAPDDKPDAPVYFLQRISVPEIAEDAHGDAYLQGAFDVGEGRYHVSWMMRDRTERVCSSNWDVDASLPSKDKQMTLDIAADAIQPVEKEPFKLEGPVARDGRGGPLNVKVMMNFAPQNSTSAALQPLDTDALLSILRNIAREPKIGKFSIVAFNMQEQRVIYRQQGASQIDFPALGEALKSLNLGTIDTKLLAQKHGDGEFLTSLMTKEIAEATEEPDAIIIAGPKVAVDDSVAPETLRLLGEARPPLFYMNYNLNPQANPWRDAIGNAVRTLKGGEYTITRPRDLFFAWAEIIGRIVKSKVGRAVAGNAASR
jgi:hypothetical protein